MFVPHIGTPELIIILVVVLIVFGVGRLPQVGGAIGRGIREFRKGQSAEEEKAAEPKKRKPRSKNSATKSNQSES